MYSTSGELIVWSKNPTQTCELSRYCIKCTTTELWQVEVTGLHHCKNCTTTVAIGW